MKRYKELTNDLGYEHFSDQQIVEQACSVLTVRKENYQLCPVTNSEAMSIVLMFGMAIQRKPEACIYFKKLGSRLDILSKLFAKLMINKLQ